MVIVVVSSLFYLSLPFCSSCVLRGRMRWERISVPIILAVGPNSFNANRLIISSLPLDLPDSGIKLGSSALQADSLFSEPLGKPPNRIFLATAEKKDTGWCWSKEKQRSLITVLSCWMKTTLNLPFFWTFQLHKSINPLDFLSQSELGFPLFAKWEV